MWLMLQQDHPDDYVIASGETYTVRQFAEWAFEAVGIRLRWEGDGVNERGVEEGTGRVRVVVDARYFRPAEVDLLWGDPAKARDKLGWRPRTGIRELIDIMVRYDMNNEGFGGAEL
jgi:GDPmannose 4,6-dehydratase